MHNILGLAADIALVSRLQVLVQRVIYIVHSLFVQVDGSRWGWRQRSNVSAGVSRRCRGSCGSEFSTYL